MKTALVVLTDGFEEIEAVAVIDILRRADVKCTIAAQPAQNMVTGKTGLRVIPDKSLGDINDLIFDMVVLPGGPGAQRLRKDKQVLALARKQASEGRRIGAICAAPTILLEAGILDGKKYTAHGSVISDLPELIADKAVVRDGNLITSRGAGTAVEFALALVEDLCGREKSSEIRQAICA